MKPISAAYVYRLQLHDRIQGVQHFDGSIIFDGELYVFMSNVTAAMARDLQCSACFDIGQLHLLFNALPSHLLSQVRASPLLVAA